MRLFCSLLVFLGFASCTNRPPAPTSDSRHSYNGGEIPVDDNIYTITGKVVADVDSLQRQTERAQSNVAVLGPVGLGAAFGPQFGGKGFVRLLVEDTSPTSALAPQGEIVIIKTSDGKASVLLPGDRVSFRCRAQYEAIAAVRDSETFSADKVATWELDYCRLGTPIIHLSEKEIPAQP